MKKKPARKAIHSRKDLEAEIDLLGNIIVKKQAEVIQQQAIIVDYRGRQAALRKDISSLENALLEANKDLEMQKTFTSIANARVDEMRKSVIGLREFNHAAVVCEIALKLLRWDASDDRN